MSKYSFDILLLYIQNDIKRQDTHWRLAITPMERLAVTLRYPNDHYYISIPKSTHVLCPNVRLLMLFN
jgi:hypothetical protein